MHYSCLLVPELIYDSVFLSVCPSVRTWENITYSSKTTIENFVCMFRDLFEFIFSFMNFDLRGHTDLIMPRFIYSKNQKITIMQPLEYQNKKL